MGNAILSAGIFQPCTSCRKCEGTRVLLAPPPQAPACTSARTVRKMWGFAPPLCLPPAPHSSQPLQRRARTCRGDVGRVEKRERETDGGGLNEARKGDPVRRSRGTELTPFHRRSCGRRIERVSKMCKMWASCTTSRSDGEQARLGHRGPVSIRAQKSPRSTVKSVSVPLSAGLDGRPRPAC